MKKKYQVFISSTFTDLQEARAKVRDAILSMYHFPVGMEIFGAANESQWKIIQDTIDSSDYYVLIIAHRYGSVIAEGSDAGKSYTEKEFHYAVSKGIPVLAFLIDEEVEINPKNLDMQNQDALKSFKEEVSKDRVIVKWKNSDDLAQKVTAALYLQIERTERPGWIRGDDSDYKNNEDLKKQISLLKSEVRDLEFENARLKAKGNRAPKVEIYFGSDTTTDWEHPGLYERSDYITEDEDGAYHLKLGNVRTTEIEAEYLPVNRAMLPAKFESYITEEDIDKYNASLPSQEKVRKYIERYTTYQRIRKHGIAIGVTVSNEGTAKATDITVDLEFPKEILILDIKKVDDYEEPNPLPKPKDLLQVAVERRNAENAIKTPIFGHGKNMGAPTILPSPSWKDIKVLAYDFTSNKEVIFLNNHEVRIKPGEGIVHTKADWFPGLYVVPLFPGEYKVKATVMCAEYETFDEFLIDFVCE